MIELDFLFREIKLVDNNVGKNVREICYRCFFNVIFKGVYILLDAIPYILLT